MRTTQIRYDYDCAADYRSAYYRARYYDPTIGRFISEDPIGFLGSGTNFYAYVKNDPINLTDPLGLCPKDKKNCLLNALRKNGVSLALDAVGFIPGEGLGRTIFDIGAGAVSTVNSAMQQDTTGAFMGIGGIHISALTPFAKDAGWSAAEAIPIAGTLLNLVSTARDGYLTWDDYQKCMSGN